MDIAYLRERPGSGPVVVEIPGGPGVAVPLPYRRFRARAARAGLDLIMVEHRGVGLSRRDVTGRDLPAPAVSVPQVVADLAAVLDAEGIERAIVSGASYGSYVAAAFAVTHPERTAGLVLDSPVLGADDYRAVRRHARALLWEGTTGDATTRRIAGKIRTLVQRDGHRPLELGASLLPLYDVGGTALVETFLDQLVVHRAPLTRRIMRLLTGPAEGDSLVRHLVETDLVAPIAFGELRFGSPVDGHIFDPGYLLGQTVAPPFTGEHYDFPAQLAAVTAPAVVICGDRDLVTPLPLAQAAATALPHATLLQLPEHGHSALDSRPAVLLAVLRALSRGDQKRLPGSARRLIAHSRGTAISESQRRALQVLLGIDRVLAPLPRTPRALR